MSLRTDDTIVAISTARGRGRRGVVRCTGPHAIDLTAALFTRPGIRASKTFDGIDWAAVDGRLRIGRSGASAPASVWVMRGPRSFTGEDVTEIHLPGSPVLLEIVIELLRREGARTAEAGEFTRRAFLNGRIDLTQAEAVAALIHARSEEERRAALGLLSGAFRTDVEGFADRLMTWLMPLELQIDFSEEDIEIIEPTNLAADLDGAAGELRSLIERAAHTRIVDDRKRVSLVGPPNAGKSSVFNMLCDRDAAIVAADAGTTRDYLEVELTVGAHDIVLVDTAGEESGGDAVKDAAQKMRRREAERAHLLVHVRDGCAVASRDRSPLEFRVATRADLVPMSERSSGEQWVSTTTGEGREGLIVTLAEHLDAADGGTAATEHLRDRHREHLTAAMTALERGAVVAAAGEGLELVAADLREALGHVREITGADYDGALLDRIMRDFCIGK